MELDVYTRPEERGAAETQAFAEAAVSALSSLGDLAGLARAYRLLGEAQTLQGRLDEGIEAFEHGARLALEAGDEREVDLPQQLMALHGTTPLPVFIAQCQQLLSNPTRRPRPEVVMRLAYALALLGDEAGARGRLEEGLGLAREVGGAFRVADAELYAGLTHLALGEPAAAAALLTRSATRLTQMGESNLRSTVEGFLGEAWFRVGDYELAAAAADKSRSLAADDDWASQLLWRQVQANLHAGRGDSEAAISLILEAAAIADRTDFLAMAASVHLDAARLLSDVGDQEAADKELGLSRELFARKGVSEGALERTRKLSG